MSDKTTLLIEQLAAKLGTTVDLLWAAMMKQAYIEATYCLLWFFVASAYLIAFGLTVRHMNKSDEYNEAEEAIYIGGGFVSLISLAAIIALPKHIITGYFNPEYWALQRILEQL